MNAEIREHIQNEAIIRRRNSQRNQIRDEALIMDDQQFRRNIEILSRRSRRDRDDAMQSAYNIEQKEYELKKDTRNNLTLLSFILFVLIILSIPYVEDPDPRDKDLLITKYNNET